jgi:hypothetical protein
MYSLGRPFGACNTLLGSCPGPSAAPPGPPLPPPPATKYNRFPADPSLQELYARMVAVLRTPEVPVYGKIFGDEVSDQLSLQMVNAIRALPQNKAILDSATCTAVNLLRTNWYWLVAAAGGMVGLSALGAWLVVRKR